ncbi:hypothetical protein MPC1_1480006 [Methylocella tundrae]|nr:hypothetical protein MPC1_1480006 [Methylocella tundrae]
MPIASGANRTRPIPRSVFASVGRRVSFGPRPRRSPARLAKPICRPARGCGCTPTRRYGIRPKNQSGQIIHSGPALIAAIEGPDGRVCGHGSISAGPRAKC